MLPPTPEPPPRNQAPTWAMVLLWAVLLGLLGGIGALARSQWMLPPIDAASVSRPSSAGSSSGLAFDATRSAAEATSAAALVQIAEAFSTSVAPTVTPLPPTPTYTLSTAIPPETCGPWLPLGTQCQMPPAPAPTATPLADCPVAPNISCIWRGSLGTPVIPTPAINHGAPWRPT